MSKSFPTLSLLFVGALIFAGCTTARISGTGTVPLVMNSVGTDVEVIESVEETQRKTFDYTGSIDVYDIVKDVLNRSDANAMVNVRLAVKSTPGDFFINVFTLGLANAYTVEVSGQLVEAPNGVASLIERGTVLDQAETTEDLAVDSADLPAPGEIEATVVRHDDRYVLVQMEN